MDNTPSRLAPGAVSTSPSLDGAVEAVKTGADEYLAKPFTDEEFLGAVSRTLDKLRMRRSGRADEADAAHVQPCGIVGASAAMREVLKAVGKAAATAATVLITGESGTGKELVSRAIHYNGPRASAPFVPVNCGGIPEGRIESELFGHVKGAFSGAAEARAGLFHAALRALREHAWPGNVRELENVMQRLVVMAESDLIDVPDLPRAMHFSTPSDAGLDRSLAEVEAEHIRGVLATAGGNKTRAAEILRIDRKTRREKLKALEQVPA